MSQSSTQEAATTHRNLQLCARCPRCDWTGRKPVCRIWIPYQSQRVGKQRARTASVRACDDVTGNDGGCARPPIRNRTQFPAGFAPPEQPGSRPFLRGSCPERRSATAISRRGQEEAAWLGPARPAELVPRRHARRQQRGSQQSFPHAQCGGGGPRVPHAAAAGRRGWVRPQRIQRLGSRSPAIKLERRAE